MYVIQYVRVSSEGQLDGTGYERQSNVNDKYCQSRGWEPKYVAMDQVSGADSDSKNRIGLVSAWCHLETIEDDEKIIVVEDSKRWARDVMVGEFLLIECRQRGIKVWSSSENIDLTVDSSDPTAKMMQQIFSVLAQWDKSITVQRLRAGRLINRQSGKGKGGIEGRKPYGVLPGELPTLRKIVELRNSGYEYKDIAHCLNSSMHRTRRGGNWKISSIQHIYKNPRSRALVPDLETV